MKKNILALTHEELSTELKDICTKKFQINQVWEWMYKKGARTFDEMTNLSIAMREKLTQGFTLDRPEIIFDNISKDGTRKWLLKFIDGRSVEMVFIPDGERGTLCISSQIGCAMGCKFCNTGSQSLRRNMTALEVLQQFIIAKDCFNDWQVEHFISNIVFMGMGEPFMNYDNVMKALRIITDPTGIGMSHRRITISTCGLVPEIKKMAHDVKAYLAISLHAPDDETRSKIMPVNRKYKVAELMEACKYYVEQTSYRRIMFEYIMIKDLNDTKEHARNLVKLVKKYNVPAKFNLIPYNPWEGNPFERSEMKTIREFAKILENAGFPAPIRTTKGDDIMAACGQLNSEKGNNKK